MTLASPVAIKVSLGEEIRRFQASREETWDGLKERIKEAFKLQDRACSLKYIDDDGDEVSIDSQGELIEAFKISEITGILRIVISENSRLLPTTPVRKEEAAPVCEKQEKKATARSPPVKEKVKSKDKSTKEAKAKKLQKKSCSEMEKGSTSNNLGSTLPGSGPPNWFTDHMNELSASLFKKIEHLPNQTITGVLSGLEGFVYQHLSGDHVRGLMPPAAPYMHPGILCDHCNNPIVGIRYKCGNCADYDLCEFCESQYGVHIEGHVFLKLRKPCKQAGVNKKGIAKPLLKKNIYTNLCEEDDYPSDSSGDSMEAVYHGHSGQNRQKKGLKKHQKEKKIRKIENHMQRLTFKLERLAAEREVESSIEASAETKEEEKLPEKQRPMDAKLVEDGNLPDMSVVPYGKEFTKEWIVCNAGSQKWSSVCLQHVAGVEPKCSNLVMPELQPGDEMRVKVDFPVLRGNFCGQILTSSFRFFFMGNDFEGPQFFGDRLWVSVVVKEVDSNGISCQLKSEDPLPLIPAPEEQVECENLLLEPCVQSSPSMVSLGEEQLPEDDSSDEFVIVIPPCFDPNKPLSESALTQQVAACGNDDVNSEMESVPGVYPDWTVLPSPDPPSQQLLVESTQDPVSPQLTPQASPRQQTRREPFRLHSRTITDATIKEPLTIATGLVNSFTNFVKDIHITRQPEELRLEPLVEDQTQQEQNNLSCEVHVDSEEDFEDASDQQPIFTDSVEVIEEPPIVTPEVPHILSSSESEEYTEIVPSCEDEGVHIPSSTPTFKLPKKYTPPQQKWSPPKQPTDQVDCLVNMGFPNRRLNAELLRKHNGHMRAVINELLDRQS